MSGFLGGEVAVILPSGGCVGVADPVSTEI